MDNKDVKLMRGIIEDSGYTGDYSIHLDSIYSDEPGVLVVTEEPINKGEMKEVIDNISSQLNVDVEVKLLDEAIGDLAGYEMLYTTNDGLPSYIAQHECDESYFEDEE